MDPCISTDSPQGGIFGSFCILYADDCGPLETILIFMFAYVNLQVLM